MRSMFMRVELGKCVGREGLEAGGDGGWGQFTRYYCDLNRPWLAE